MTVDQYPRDHGSLANLDKDHHPQYHKDSDDLVANALSVLGLVQGDLNFGATTRQMLHLYGNMPNNYGIGIQGYTMYYRVVSNAQGGFAWYGGGEHSDVRRDPGPGGIFLMSLLQSHLQVHDGGVFPELLDNSRTNASAPSAYPVGYSLMSVENDTAAAWPGGAHYGTVQTFKNDRGGTPGRGFQLFTDGISAASPIWARRIVSGSDSWNAWTLITSEPWVAVSTFYNGWVNYGGSWETAGYRKEAGNIVRLKGLVKSGTADHIFILPAGYRPATNRIFTQKCASAGVARVDVYPTGYVYIRLATTETTGGPATWTTLNGLTFVADGA